jgi:hypothetical protein
MRCCVMLSMICSTLMLEKGSSHVNSSHRILLEKGGCGGRGGEGR